MSLLLRAMNDRTADRWHRLDTLLDEALARAPDARSAYLRAACGDDPALYAEAVALLTSADEAARSLGESAVTFATPLLAGEGEAPPEAGLAPGARVGPYRVEGEAGRGGMGVVYRATRADGAFRKEVALKLVKRGMDTDDVLARFRRERQVLAGLDHPAIARLLDGGAADDGRPYLVMEYVEGEPITAYCDRRRLGVEARLALFERVCEAVQHAHRRLVVHRDLKPSNVLVAEGEGGAAQVKLLDFGIAKLLEEGADETMTRTGARRLTPAYAAPEQVRGEPVTTAADVYALGVVLHELLVGQRPAPPRPPSAAVVPEAALARGAAPEQLRRRLRGDLDTICLKALREEAHERYPSVESLLDDLRRHRAGLPVAARPASRGYRVRKFVARHRTGVAAAAAFVLLLAASAVALALQQRQTARERDRAQAATRFLASLFDATLPGQAGPDSLTAFGLLEQGARRLDTELTGEPELRAQLLYLFGRFYDGFGHLEQARRYAQQALALKEHLYGAGSPETAASLVHLATLQYQLGARPAADSLFEEWERMLPLISDTADPELADRLAEAAKVLHHRRDLERADELGRRARDMYLRLYGPRHRKPIDAAVGLAMVWLAQDRPSEAEVLLREQWGHIDHLEDRGEGVYNLRFNVLTGLGGAMSKQGRFGEAAATYREALAVRSTYEEYTPAVAAWTMNLADALRADGQLEEAEAAYREALAGFAATYGADAFYTLHVQHLLADVVREQGAFSEAEPLLLDAYRGLRVARGGEDAYTQEALSSLVALYEAWGRADEAARYRALRMQRDASDPAPRATPR